MYIYLNEIHFIINSNRRQYTFGLMNYNTSNESKD